MRGIAAARTSAVRPLRRIEPRPNSQRWRCPSSACRHLLPRGEEGCHGLPRNPGEFGDLSGRGADAGEQRQTVGADGKILVVYQHMLEE
jgi:hypothetical protein